MKNKTFSIRLAPELLEWLEEQAKKDNRSLNNYIETVLIRHKEDKGE